jgi:hypothetical protein
VALTEAQAQTNTVPPNLWDYLTTGSNYFGGGFGTYSTGDHSTGGGLFVGYRATDFLAPVVRLDYWNHTIYTMSLNIELQPPRTIMGKIPVVPFALAGVETPLQGNASTDACVGAGAAVKLDFLGSSWLPTHLDIVADYEQHFGLPDAQKHQIRLGLLLKF